MYGNQIRRKQKFKGNSEHSKADVKKYHFIFYIEIVLTKKTQKKLVQIPWHTDSLLTTLCSVMKESNLLYL